MLKRNASIAVLTLMCIGVTVTGPAAFAGLDGDFNNNGVIDAADLMAFSAYWRTDTADNWAAIPLPVTDVVELVGSGDFLFARSAKAVFRSAEAGENWQTVIGVTSGADPFYLGGFLAMDEDLGNLYLATGSGLLVSDDDGESFEWSFPWDWDPMTAVDFVNGVGWLTIMNWGSESGLQRKLPNGAWERLVAWSFSRVIADTIQPATVAYTTAISLGNSVTRDGGKHWETTPAAVTFNAVIDATSFAFGKPSLPNGHSRFSQDAGQTWQDLGLAASTFAQDPQTQGIFAASESDQPGAKGVYFGRPSQWQPVGLADHQVQSLAVCQGYIFALLADGKLFRASITPLEPSNLADFTADGLVNQKDLLLYLQNRQANPQPTPTPTVVPNFTSWAQNNSSITTCAEDDNVNIPLFSPGVNLFQVIATHPAYCPCVDADCSPDSSGCGKERKTDTCRELYNDHSNNILTGCTVPDWWRGSQTMTVEMGGNAVPVHYIVWQQRINGSAASPGFFVLYQDGSMRLKPQPPFGVADVCYGSSVIIGPATPTTRPYVDIKNIHINAGLAGLVVTYRNGETATITLAVNRLQAVVYVAVGYQADETMPFATFRSMWLSDDNCDAARVEYRTGASTGDYNIINGWSLLEGPGWSFYRDSQSSHNKSSPDIAIQIIN